MQEPAPIAWNSGEREMHRLLHAPTVPNPTVPGLPYAVARWMATAPLIVLGAEDRVGRVWTTVLGGQESLVRPLGDSLVAIRTGAPSSTRSDPVLQALQQTGEGGNHHPHLAGLALDLEHRNRVKFAGTLAWATAGAQRESPASDGQPIERLVVEVDEALGNCPKYLNRKMITAADADAVVRESNLPLSSEATAMIDRADVFFLSTHAADGTMDTNIRGGSAGFVRMMRNSAADGVVLAYPEYSGNRLYQSLGNLKTDDRIGMTIVDFIDGSMLYLSGHAEIIIGDEADAVMPHSSVVVLITITDAKRVTGAASFRGAPLEASPYNPPVRPLRAERSGAVSASVPDASHVHVIRKERLSPMISRYTFRLDDASSEGVRKNPWASGDHVTLDFGAALHTGWSHMRDEDPASLNDDFIRSFTVTSPPPSLGDSGSSDHPVEFDIIAREAGPVTRYLGTRSANSPISARLVEFSSDGEEAGPLDTELSTDATEVFVSGGIGITPVLARATDPHGFPARTHLLWGLSAADIDLAIAALEPLRHRFITVDVFLSGTSDAAGAAQLRELGVDVHLRRMTETDVKRYGTAGRRMFSVCAGAGLTAAARTWLAGETTSFRTFTF